MNFDTTETGWAKDEVLLEHIKDCLDSTEQQDFVFTVSDQGTAAILRSASLSIRT